MDPPYVERVEGTIGSTSFAWVLAEWRAQHRTTTQEQQQQRFAHAWDRMSAISEPRRRRLVAGLHCFHVACRLAREGCTAGEFIAEVVLNLAKSLEVLFPPPGDGRTRDTARAGLASLAFRTKRSTATSAVSSFVSPRRMKNRYATLITTRLSAWPCLMSALAARLSGTSFSSISSLRAHAAPRRIGTSWLCRRSIRVNAMSHQAHVVRALHILAEQGWLLKTRDGNKCP